MGQRAGYGFSFGDGGGLGAIPFAIRTTDSQPAIFLSTVARDAYYTANPGDIAAGTELANQREAVGIGPTDGDPVGVTAAFIRNAANDAWIPIATNFVGGQGPEGPEGPTGPAGADGVRRMFPNVDARDAFYATQLNRNDLMTDDVISVNVGTNLVEFQRWLGASAPTDYDPNDFVPTSIRTANASINFGDELRIFDYGEFVGFEDRINDVTALAIGQRYSDATGSETARQLVFPAEGVLAVTTGATTSALLAVHEYTEDTTGFLTNPAIVLSNTIDFAVAPNFYILEIFVGTDDTGTRIFRERFEPAGVAGVFTQRPDSPQRFLPNTTYFLRFTGDIPFSFTVADTPMAIAAVGTTTGFEFTLENMATENFVRDTLAGLDNAVGVSTAVTITSGNQATYERKLVYLDPVVTGNVTITISQDLDFDGFAFYVVGTGTLTIAGTGTVTIEGDTSRVFSQYQGGRLFPTPDDGNLYGILYDNNALPVEAVQDIVGAMATGGTQVNIAVAYDDVAGVLNFTAAAGNITVEDEGTPLTGSADTLNFTGAGVTASGTGSTKTVNIPGGSGSPLDQVFQYNPTGNQDLGVDIAGDIHLFGVNTTSITILDGTTITSLRWFAMVIEGTTDVTFNLATSGFQFDGVSSGTTYALPAGAATLFYVVSGFIYPISSTAGGGAAGTDHPVTLIRDTPNLATLAALAAASVNSNTGLWIASNDQVQSIEDTVDPTIMIRALKTGLLDANNSVLSTDAAEKRTVRLQAGTVVRVFSSTDLRIVSTPTVREAAARYPDLANLTVSPLSIVGNQAIYNLHRNRTTVLTDAATTGTSTWEVRLPSLANAFDLAYLNRNDVFGFRNDRTDSLVLKIRAFQVGTSFSDGSAQIDIAPGQALFTSPAPSGRVWQILEFGQATDLPETISINTDWYRDGTDATAVDNYVRLHHRQEVVDGDLREHIDTVASANNPISVRFQSRNVQDDIAWINWWSTFDGAVPPLTGGSDPSLIIAQIPAALAYIETNINNGFDFEFDDPALDAGGTTLAVTAITFLSGNTYRINIATALSAHIAVNDTIQIANAANAQNNGTHTIINILPDRLAFDIDISPNDGAASDEGAGAFVTRLIYTDAVFISHTLRQVNFNLYRDVARTVLLTVYPQSWFSTDPLVFSLFAIGYNNDVQTTSSQIAIQDDTDEFFLVKGGPRGTVVDFDNITPNYQNLRTLPVNFEQINIRSDGIANYVIPEFPSQLLVNESRRYTLWASPDNVSLNDVSIVVGENANRVTFDEGFEALDILPGTQHTIELYNNGVTSGVKLVTPISKTLESTNIFNPAQGADTAQIDPLRVSIADVIAATNEDINGRFFGVGAPVLNQVQLRADADYIFSLSIDVLFNGTEPSGISFVPITLMPIINGVDQPRLSDTVSLVFSRNGLSGAAAPKFTHTLSSTFEYQGSANDTVAFDVRFGTFPAGFSTADIQVQDFSYQFTAQTGLN